MIITYTIDQMNFPTLEVAEDMELENLVALILLENPALNNIEKSRLYMIHDGVKTMFNDENMKKKLKVCRPKLLHVFRYMNVSLFQDIGLQNNSFFYVGRSAEVSQAGSSRPGASNTQSGSQADMISRLVKSIKVPGTQTKRPNMKDQVKAMDDAINHDKFHQFARHVFQQISDPVGQLRFRDEYPKALEQYNKQPMNFGMLFSLSYVLVINLFCL